MLVFLDIETTGFDGKQDELLEISAIKWDEEKECGRFDTLISLPIDFQIPSMITSLTGISTQMCEENGINIEKAIQDLKNFLHPEDIIVGHNISFDIGFLNDKGANLTNIMIDTFLLSLLLLGQKETSHALEILAQKYGILQENAHRAMSDCEANLQFYSFLQTKWKHEKDEKFEKWIHQMAPKIDFPEYYFFQNPPKIEFKPSIQKKDISINPLSIKGTNFPKNINYKTTFPILMECSSSESTLFNIIEISAKEKTPLWIAYPLDEIETALETFEQVKKEFPEMSHDFFGNPFQKIDIKKWNSFCSNSSFNREESIVLTKIFKAFQENTEHYLRFFSEEWKVARNIFSQEKEVPDSEKDIVFIPFTEIYHAQHSAKIVIMRGENIETMLEEKEKIKVFQKRIQEDIPHFGEDIFQSISSSLRKEKGENKYTLPIYESEFRFSEEITKNIKKLEEIIRIDNSWSTWQWKHFFDTKGSEDFIFCIELFPDDFLAFSLIPKKLQDSFDEMCASGSGIILIGKSFPKNKSKSLQFTFEVPDETILIPYQKEYPKISYEYSEKIIQQHLKNNKNVIIAVGSKKYGEDIVDTMRNFCEENNIFIVAQKGGSIRKMRAMMKNETPCLIIGTTPFLDNLRIEFLENSIIVITKLSFDPPNHPVFKFRREKLQNDFEDFAFPRASQRLHRDIRRISNPEEIIISDPKMQQAWAKKMIDF